MFTIQKLRTPSPISLIDENPGWSLLIQNGREL
jgi:hypothetical protein